MKKQTKEKEIRYCAECKKEFNLNAQCCEFCHEDHEDEGFPLCTIETKKIVYFVCCSVKDAYNLKQKEEENNE